MVEARCPDCGQDLSVGGTPAMTAENVPTVTRERALLVCGVELVSWLQGFIEGTGKEGLSESVTSWVADVWDLFAGDTDGR